MLTSLFRKSTPLSYTIVIASTVLIVFLFHTWAPARADDNSLFIHLGMLLVVLGSLFLSNFIVKKNALSRDSAYTALFYLLFLMFFPRVLDRPDLMLSNFFIMLALRRLISLHSLKSTKEKIFDASLWVFIAAFFHFWSILFILLVFISILFHVSRDYRNWVLPFLAFFASAIVFLLFAMVVDPSLIKDVLAKAAADFKLAIDVNNITTIALGVFALFGLFFTLSMIFTVSGRPMQLQSSYKKIVASFFLGALIYLISPGKSNELLIFTFAPLAILATSHIELPQKQLKQEILLALIILAGATLFVLQL